MAEPFFSDVMENCGRAALPPIVMGFSIEGVTLPNPISALLNALRVGPTLSEAADLHAPKSLIRKLKAIKPPESPYIYPGIKMMAAHLEASQREQFLGAAKNTSVAWSQYKATNAILQEIKESLCRQLSAGKLLAYGYEAALPKVVSLIPSYLFEHFEFIHWGQSAVKGPNLEYLSVKVLPASHEAVADSPKNITQKFSSIGAGGRPTAKRRVSEAIWALMKEEGNFAGLPNKTKTTKVRNYILKNHPTEFPGGKGLHDKTLATHIRNLEGRQIPPKG